MRIRSHYVPDLFTLAFFIIESAICMLQKARESKGEVKDEELVLGVFVYEALSKAVAAAVVDDIQKLGMFALLGAGKYLGIVM